MSTGAGWIPAATARSMSRERHSMRAFFRGKKPAPPQSGQSVGPKSVGISPDPPQLVQLGSF